MERIIDLFQQVTGKFKDEIGGKIMTEFCALREKAYSFLMDDYSDEDVEKSSYKKMCSKERSYVSKL